MPQRWGLLTPRGRLVLGCGGMLVLGGMALGQVDLIRAGALAVAVVAVVLLWMRRHPVGLEVTREVSPLRVSVDEPATVRLTLTNPQPRATPLLLVEERLAYELGDRPRFVVPRLDPGGVCRTSYTLRPHRRGLQPLGPLTVRVRDAFGLTLRPAVLAEAHQLLVLPRMHPLPAVPLLGTGLATEGRRSKVLALHGEDDQTVRPYQDGDDRRRIHWPATARTGELMVRQEDRPAHPRAVVVLDTRASAHTGSGATSTLEWAVTMTASVIGHLAGQGYRVSLLCADPEVAGGVVESVDIQDALAVLATVTSGSDALFAEVVRRAGVAMSPGGLFALVGGRLGEADAGALRGLRWSGARALALLCVDDASMPPGGSILLRQGWRAGATSPRVGPADHWAAVAGAAQRTGSPVSLR